MNDHDCEPNPTLKVAVFGPGTAEDLENGGREAVARNGFQVGEFTLDEDLTPDNKGILGSLEVDRRLADDLERGRADTMELTWGEYVVVIDKQ